MDNTKDWQLYQQGIDFNNKINYYSTVDNNWTFYNGDQWAGVVSNGLPTPVFNVLKRIINYFIASIMSRKVTGSYRFENIPDVPQTQEEETLKNVAELLSSTSKLKWEKNKMDSLLRECLLDASNGGDMCTYTYWDSSIETGQPVKGDFVTERIDGGNVFFGNPNCRIVEKQPYILITGRESVENLRKEAKANGVKDEQLKLIVADTETEYQTGKSGKMEIDSKYDEGKCLYVIKFWKQNNTVFWRKSTRNTEIVKEVDLGIRVYPIAWANWEMTKNNYHGQSVSKGLIPNQILINKMFAMVSLWLMNSAFGKVIYDVNRIPAWSNQIGTAQPVEGDLTGAVQQVNAGTMNTTIIQIIEKTIQYTKEMLGANDSALGQVNPEQASGTAIIATQKQASIPLQNVEASLYQFVEDIYIIWGEFILKKYNADRKLSYEDTEGLKTAMFNSSEYMNLLFNVNIDVGASSYWSEIASMQSLDNLLASDRISIVQYLERVPDGMIPKLQELIDEKKEEELQQQQQQQEKPPSADEEKLYEQMAQFMESLPEDVQAQLQALPPDQMEEAVIDMMNQGGETSGGM